MKVALMNDPRRLAWVVDDDAHSRADVQETLRVLKFRRVSASSQSEFVHLLEDVADGIAAPPDLVVMDLRLPWAEEAVLVRNPLAGGQGCLGLLRQEPLTSNVPVIVYSAFVRDDLISRELIPYQPLIVVDKVESARLPLVVKNLVPVRQLSLVARVTRFVASGERRWLRVAAVVGPVFAIVAAVVALSRACT